MLRFRTRRGGTIGLFTLIAMVTIPITFSAALAPLTLGRELTWFRVLSPEGSAWVRNAFAAASLASLVCAFLFREKRRDS